MHGTVVQSNNPNIAQGSSAQGQVASSISKKALSIGIQYGDAAVYAKIGGDPPPQLPHAHKDPEVLKALLIRVYGYKEEDISILMDDGKHTSPTRDNILKAIDRMVKGAKAGDHFVFHFSGHGSQVENTDHNDYEPDDLDEVIWPVDIVYDKDSDDAKSNYIKDDELKQYLVDGLPPGTHLTVILDCCHSGTGVDLPFIHSDDSGSEIWSSPIVSSKTPSANYKPWEVPRRQGPKVRAKGSFKLKMPFMEHSPPHPELNKPSPGIQVTQILRDKLMQAKVEFDERNKGKYVTSWAACADEEVTFDGPDGGLLTHAFSNILCSNQHLTHRELLIALSTHLAKTLRPAKHQAGQFAMACPRPILGSLHRMRDIYEIPFVF